MLHAVIWRPLFLTALLIADKVWQDNPVRNSALTKLFPVLSNAELKKLEYYFIAQIDFDCLVTPQSFSDFCERLLTERVHPEINERVRTHDFISTLGGYEGLTPQGAAGRTTLSSLHQRSPTLASPPSGKPLVATRGSGDSPRLASPPPGKPLVATRGSGGSPTRVSSHTPSSHREDGTPLPSSHRRGQLFPAGGSADTDQGSVTRRHLGSSPPPQQNQPPSVAVGGAVSGEASPYRYSIGGKIGAAMQGRSSGGGRLGSVAETNPRASFSGLAMGGGTAPHAQQAQTPAPPGQWRRKDPSAAAHTGVQTGVESTPGSAALRPYAGGTRAQGGASHSAPPAAGVATKTAPTMVRNTVVPTGRAAAVKKSMMVPNELARASTVTPAQQRPRAALQRGAPQASNRATMPAMRSSQLSQTAPRAGSKAPGAGTAMGGSAAAPSGTTAARGMSAARFTGTSSYVGPAGGAAAVPQSPPRSVWQDSSARSPAASPTSATSASRLLMTARGRSSSPAYVAEPVSSTPFTARQPRFPR